MSFLVVIGFILLKILFIILKGDNMKKIFFFIVVLLFPFFVFAYSHYIIPGGDTLGIEVNSKGVYVVGFYKVDGKNINNDLKVGDIIIKIHNQEINDYSSMIEYIHEYMNNDTVDITYIRDGIEYHKQLQLVPKENEYKTGLYVKNSIIGVGTLTYIDPESKIYGILGHSLNTKYNSQSIDVYSGYTYDASVKSFTRSSNGSPGSKNAVILKERLFGEINHNSDYGVYGKTENVISRDYMEVGSLSDVHEGSAYILTSDLDNHIGKYDIQIIKVDSKNQDKNLYFEITDKDLIQLSGGIVQGMSGSPIIQNNKIVGAVTRVVVDDVKKGYGISIITMLEEGDKIK